MSTETKDKKNYKDTLNLPKTDFAMEAKLVANEPLRLAKWREMDLYGKVMASRPPEKKWVLHDGPPFANGDIHIGHLINKTLKDVIIRFRTMQGYQTPYVPGWDCHGLPIEHKIQEQLGSKWREMDVAAVRKLCFEYAQKYAGLQSEQFQRLGILGDWKHPYLTMTPAYEASTLEVFAKFVEAGLVYKKLKPVPWSVSNQTALADAELEYREVTDISVYVEFPAVMSQDFGELADIDQSEQVFFWVWTTTPWTLPANLAIALHPDIEYALFRYQRDGEQRIGISAVDLLEQVKKIAGVEVEEIERRTGRNFFINTVSMADRHIRYRHPFLDGQFGQLVAATYITTTDGTGLVHTAPGHGEDDYDTGIKYGLPVYSPVLANGRFDRSVPEWLQGKTVWEGNPIIIEKLREKGLLLASQPVLHSYPHDWRSKKPIIFRATEQWFVAMDLPFRVREEPQDLPKLSLRQRGRYSQRLDLSVVHSLKMEGDASALGIGRELDPAESAEKELGPPSIVLSPEQTKAVEKLPTVDFVPEWGRNRLHGMIVSRPDWCISRQRAWGLPIPIFYNVETNEPLLDANAIKAVAKRFGDKGSDSWFTDSPSELLGAYDPGPKFPKDKLRKEKDIFDVWFESGSSWHGVLLARGELKFPADLYLEGSDQHRGWFQLSLLPSLGVMGVPPFKQVLTHGFVVKPDGTKVSKSDKEYVTATKEIDTHGADVLRLWCSSVDYQHDIPSSPQAIKEFGDKYRKIRNTLRYLLSNLYDYVPTEINIPPQSLDAWALAELDKLIEDVADEKEGAYANYQLHKVFRFLHDFCAVQISAVYGNAMKDRLYCERPDSVLRRRCQSVMHRMAMALTKMLAPILVFTADEAWEQIQHKPAGETDLASVHLALLPTPSELKISDDQREEWKLLMELRNQALLQLDQLKKQAGMNKALDAEVIYYVNDPQMRARLQAYGSDLEDLVGAGHHSIEEQSADGQSISVKVIDRRETYPACARSWKRRPDVGQDAEYPDLSLRDAQAVRNSRGS